MQSFASKGIGNLEKTQPFSGAIIFNSVISPAALTSSATIDDYSPPGFGNCNVLRIKTSGIGNVTISGISGGTPGRLLIIENIGMDGTNGKFIFDGTAGSSTTRNRFDTIAGTPRELGLGEMVWVIYDGKTKLWRVLGLGIPLLDNVVFKDLANAFTALNSFNAVGGIQILNSAASIDGVYGSFLADVDPDNVSITALYLAPSTDNTNRLFFGSSGLRWLALNFDNVSEFQKVPKITTYNGVATQGWGLVAVQKVGRFLTQSGAKTILTFTPTADGSFEVSANVFLISTGIGSSFTVTVTYTDEGGNSRTLTLPFSSAAGTFLTPITATGVYEGVALHIRAKASNAITMQTVGTFNTISYNVEGAIRQLA